MASSLEMENIHTEALQDHESENSPEKEEECFFYALQLVTSSALSMSMQCAMKPGVFDIIRKAGEGSKLSSAEIATQLGTNSPEAPTVLDSIIRLLACHAVLNCSVNAEDINSGSFQRLYSLASVSKFFVTNKDGVSVGPLLSLE